MGIYFLHKALLLLAAQQIAVSHLLDSIGGYFIRSSEIDIWYNCIPLSKRETSSLVLWKEPWDIFSKFEDDGWLLPLGNE